MAEPRADKKLSALQRYRRLPKNVLALSLVSLLNDTSSDIIYPVLPAFLALSLGASPFAIGLIEGFAESIASILKLFSGYLSDRFGTRKLPVWFLRFNNPDEPIIVYAVSATNESTSASELAWHASMTSRSNPSAQPQELGIPNLIASNNLF